MLVKPAGGRYDPMELDVLDKGENYFVGNKSRNLLIFLLRWRGTVEGERMEGEKHKQDRERLKLCKVVKTSRYEIGEEHSRMVIPNLFLDNRV